MKESVPVSDEALDKSRDLFNHLVPYHNDYCCHRSYCHSFEVTPADLQVQIPTSGCDDQRAGSFGRNGETGGRR